jgi:hypothetical protein
LLDILDQTKSVDAFLTAVSFLAEEPEARTAIPAVIRNAERLGIYGRFTLDEKASGAAMAKQLTAQLTQMAKGKKAVVPVQTEQKEIQPPPPPLTPPPLTPLSPLGRGVESEGRSSDSSFRAGPVQRETMNRKNPSPPTALPASGEKRLGAVGTGKDLWKRFKEQIASVSSQVWPKVENTGSVRELTDPCWPERYNYMANKEAGSAIGGVMNNGKVLDQTIWNYHFEPGTDRLTAGGLDHLAYLVRRRPQPEPHIYVQPSQDAGKDLAGLEKKAARLELDRKRKRAIESFLAAHMVGKQSKIQVLIQDP